MIDDKLKFSYDEFRYYKEEIVKDKEKYKPVLLELLEENRINSNIYMSIIKLWEKEWSEEPNIEIDKLKFDKCTFKNCKEEIKGDKERYKPALLEVLEEDKANSNIKEEVIEIWEKEWKEEANIYIDKLKFRNDDIFKEYKEEIEGNKERYKPALLELLEENTINSNICMSIIKLWEKEWSEEPNIEIDKLKFKYKNILRNYKEEIEGNKERYKPALLKVLEEDKANSIIKEEIIEIWEDKWKEVSNEYINKLKIEIDKLKFNNKRFEEYKEEIINDKERYKPVLLELLEKNKIDEDIYIEIIELWEDEWKEVPNIYIDKLKFYYSNYDKIYLFKEYKEEIKRDKERYKPALLRIMEENRYISFNIYKEIIEIWEKEWKEEPSIEIDKLKFNYYTFQEYKEEIKRDKERYKLILLELLEKNKISQYIYKEIIDIWENEWEEEPNIDIDKLKFYYDIFKYYKEEIGKNKERYKPIFLELLKKDKINNRIYKEIIDIWDNEWREEPNEYLDKLKFYYYSYNNINLFSKYKDEIEKNKERYKPILLELIKKNRIDSDIYEKIETIWEEKWKEEGEIEGNSELIDIDNVDYFIENRDEVINNREKYEATVRRYFVPVTYREIKPILNSWGESDIELLTKLLLKSTYKIYSILYSTLKDELLEHKESIIENISKNYKIKLKDKTVKLFILSTAQTIDELENKLEVLKINDMDKLVEYLIKLDLDKDIDSEVSKNVVKIVTDKISEMEYIKLMIELKKDKDNLSKNCIEILKNILDKIENKEALENLAKELRFNNPIEMLEYLRDGRVPIEITKCIEVLRDIFNKIDSKEKLDKVVEEYGFNNPIEMLEYLRDGRVPIEITKCIEVLRDIFNKIDSKEKLDKVVEEYGFNNPIEMLKYLKVKKAPIEIIEIYYKLLEEYYPNEFDEFKKNLGERLLEKFDGSSYENCIEYSKYRDILDNFLNYEDIMKFNITIENGRYLNKKKISGADIEYGEKEKIKIAYWSSYKPFKKLSKVEEYIENILPKDKKYINYEIDDLGFNDKKERYFRYNDNNIVVKLKDRKLQIFNSSGTEIKKLSSTKEDFYTVRTIENIKELKKMVKNVYTDGDKGIQKEYCNDILRDYDLWREIYIDNVMLQEYLTKLIWEEVDSDDNIVGRFRYSEENKEFCDSNDDEYIINKENKIRLLSLDKVSNDEVDRWREQFDDYEIVQPVPQLELYNLDYSDIELSNREIELGKLEKNLTLKFKDDEMYFEIENILTIELEDKINWVEYKKLSKDTIVKISKINLITDSDYSLRVVKLVKNKLGI